MEAQLDPAIHSIALCKSEIEKEAHLLAEEKQNLEALEKNARTEESVYKRHASQVGLASAGYLCHGTEGLFLAPHSTAFRGSCQGRAWS